MIPMGDNLNHSSVEATYEVINKQMHKDVTFWNPLYFEKGKMMNDYRALYSEEELAEMDEKQMKNVSGRFNKRLF